ncbi:hypothetical protein SDC9_105540 [bioreactor metagenome]|uniref:Uncharacterized protein n=1 Tax=bioreactor metagenome TaxID=1076179 RepID=A0A645AZW7_9ZZZZ
MQRGPPFAVKGNTFIRQIIFQRKNKPIILGAGIDHVGKGGGDAACVQVIDYNQYLHTNPLFIWKLPYIHSESHERSFAVNLFG